MTFARRVALCASLVLSAYGCDGPTIARDGGVVGDASQDAFASGDGAVDAAVIDAAEPDAGADASVPRCEVAPEGPGRVLFIGNSFTFTADMPGVFERLATASGFPPPDVAMRAVGGQTLAFHRADNTAEGAVARIDEGTWDVVVLQEFSTRPTDSVGPAEQFKIDATWLYDRAVAARPDVRIVAYQTFARRFSHSLYPGTFDDPEDMQDQLRFHYDDWAERYLGKHSSSPAPHADVARVGDAWELSLADGEPPRLHASDDYHPSAAGAYLTALVFFGTIYHRTTVGLPAIGVDAATAADLQSVADRVTGATEAPPFIACPPEVPLGDRVLVDFGPIEADGWNAHESIAGSTGPIASEAGVATGVVVTTRGFTGTQTGGATTNDLGYPGGVGQDSLWVGSFDGHEAALARDAEVELSGLTPGSYTITLSASRDGTDGAAGRLTRYAIEGATRDLDVADNRARTAVFEDVAPDADGHVVITVGVSPDGAARFGYVGSLIVERTR